MKNLFLSLLLSIPVLLPAQVEYLRLSPAQKISQRVGMTDVDIEFSRPQMKGRTIFGELVPYDQLWRTGANENTTISFSHRVRIGDTEVAAGQYAIFTKPMKDNWEIYFYSDTEGLGIPNPIDSSKLIYLTSVDSRQRAEVEETLVINIYDITETSANLGISWEHTRVDIPITFYTREAMETQFKTEFDQNIFDLTIAATYYYERGIELEKAKELQEIAIRLQGEPSVWDLHRYGIIHMKMGKREEAVEYLTRSLEMAVNVNNEYLIGENEKYLLRIENE